MDEILASILIVNFNGAPHLPACLSALEQLSAPRHTFEVILVDNASSDRSIELIRSRFPWVRLLTLNRNTGFAEGTNIAARSAHGRFLVLLNNDTIPDPFWLEELIRTTRTGDRSASKLVFVHNPKVLNSAGLFLLRDGRGADRGFRQNDLGQHECCEPVFAGCGAALALLAAPASAPVLDPHFFLYYEDLDAGWRARLACRGTTYCPRSLVRHVHGAAAGDRSAVFHFYVERNRAFSSLRNGDLFLAASSFAVLGGKLVRAIARTLLKRESWQTTRAFGRALGSFVMSIPRGLAERLATRSEAGRCGS